MKLIDLDKILKQKQYCFKVQGEPFPKSDYFIRVSDILSIPEEDAHHTVYGQWEYHSRYKELDNWKCSNCGNVRYGQSLFCPSCGAIMSAPERNDVKCIDCEYLMFSDCYGECSKAYKGIVNPDDSCGYGVPRGNA